MAHLMRACKAQQPGKDPARCSWSRVCSCIRWEMSPWEFAPLDDTGKETALAGCLWIIS